MTAASYPLIFIGGAPRSGTTLMRRLLGAHSRIYAGPEFDVVPDFVRLRDKMHAKIRDGRISAVTDEASVDTALADALRRLLSAKAEREGADIYCEKTPINVSVFPQLLDMFPEAKLVFAIRDPRAVAASMKQVAQRYRAEGDTPPPFVRSVRASALEINRLWARGFEALERNPERVTAVHYEDLVAKPEETSRKLCAFLGIGFEPDMIKVEKKTYDRAADQNVTHWYNDQQFQRPIGTDRLEAWREVLTPAEIGLVERLIVSHPLSDRYALGASGTPFSTRALEARHALGRAVVRLRRGVGRRLPG